MNSGIAFSTKHSMYPTLEFSQNESWLCCVLFKKTLKWLCNSLQGCLTRLWGLNVCPASCTDCLHMKHNIGLEGVNLHSYLSVSLAVYPEPMSIDSSKSLSMHGMNSATKTDFIRCHRELWSPPKQLWGPWTMRYINARPQQSEFLIDSFNLLYRINDLEECIRFLSQMLLIERWSSENAAVTYQSGTPWSSAV